MYFEMIIAWEPTNLYSVQMIATTNFNYNRLLPLWAWNIILFGILHISIKEVTVIELLARVMLWQFKADVSQTGLFYTILRH